MSEAKKFYSSHRNPTLIHQATLKLLEDNIINLLSDIYDEKKQKGIYGHPEVRIGLSLKLLHNIRIDLDESILKPIIKDIEMLMESPDYLESTGDAERRKKCLQEELNFINRYIDLEDTISLNTIEPRPQPKKSSQTISIMEQDLIASRNEINKNNPRIKEKIDENATCVIQ